MKNEIALSSALETYSEDLIDEGYSNCRLIIRTPEYWEASAQQLVDFPEIEQRILSDLEKKYNGLICTKCKGTEFRVSGMYDFEIIDSGEEIRKYSLSCNGCGRLNHLWSDPKPKKSIKNQ
jgi:hypothetical protein